MAVASKKVPVGMYMVADLVELHAEDHALRKAFVESVFPSPFAPKLVTLYVTFAAAADDKIAITTRKRLFMLYVYV